MEAFTAVGVESNAVSGNSADHGGGGGKGRKETHREVVKC